MRIQFVSQGMLSDGGMPSDLRSLVVAVSQYCGGNVGVIADASGDELVELNGVEITHAPSVASLLKLQLVDFTPEDIFVFVGFSSLYNIILAERLRRYGLRYTVITAWQVHEFLDWDNPFERASVPSIENIHAGKAVTKYCLFGRVRQGQRTPSSFMQALRRKIYRLTVGRRLLNGAQVIQVFSDFERTYIQTLIKPSHSNYQIIHFGSNVLLRTIGSDSYPSNDRINLVFWGRADYYYKGIDTLLAGLAFACKEDTTMPIKLWIIGPDYNGGYESIRKDIERYELAGCVEIITQERYTPGTVGLLKRADFCILTPKWDGYSRTLRESVCLGVPVITNKETHFDDVISRFGNGLIIKDAADLGKILLRLSSAEIMEIRRAAADNQNTTVEYFQWDSAARKFVSTLPLKLA